MKILAFETSCDDTSIALFENDTLISMHTASQIKIHNQTGGVVPEVASREHANVIFDVLDNVLTQGIKKGILCRDAISCVGEKQKDLKYSVSKALQEIDYIAVTTFPGLIPSLLTGITVASTISKTLKIPVLEIDHIQAHIFSPFLERKESDIRFPLVCLTVSGGHNEIYYMPDMWTREKLGQTQDDAAGEAFDKVAKMMGLEYPGGPVISRLANDYKRQVSGDQSRKALFPRVFLEKSEFGFSFSGLKSAVKREVDQRISDRSHETCLSDKDKKEISYEFQNAVNEVLCYKLINAAGEKGVSTILLAGGVSANDDLNARIMLEAQKKDLDFYAPIKKKYSMDNAAMIGILAYYRIKYGKFEHQIGGVTVGSW